MTGHLSDEQIELYRSRSLSPDGIVSMSEHLISCDGCYKRFRRGEPPEEWVSIRLEEASDRENGRLTGEVHTRSSGVEVQADRGSVSHDPYYRHLERYVDEEMPGPERSTFELHLESCRTCREEVADLLELKTLMSGAEVVGTGVEVQGVAPEHGVSQAVAVSSYLRPVPIWAGVAAALLLALSASIVVSLAFQREVQRLRQQVATLEKRATEFEDQAKAQTEDVNSRLKTLETRGQGPVDEGDGQHPAAGAPVKLQDGGRIIELRQGLLKGLESAPVNSQKAVELAIESSRVEVPQMGMLLGKTSTLMSSKEGPALFSLTGPLGIVVEEDRPLFTWTPVPRAVAYTVIIGGAKSPRLFRSAPLRETQWRAEEPLPRGDVYTWEVQATLDDGQETSAPAPPAPMAKFKVLGASDENRLREARRLNPQSHLLLGVLYGRAGLIGAARQELQELLEQNPESDLARKLLRSVEQRAKP